MGKKIISITFAELKKDMIIAKDVDRNGKVLLKKDTKINEQMIKKLQRLLLIGNVERYDPESLTKDLSLEEKKLQEFNKVEDEFKEISSKLQRTFRSIQNEDGECMREIREFSRRIQDELKPSSVVIKNIVLHGSGSDVIYRHGVNVAALSALIGKWIGYDKTQLNLLVYSAILHDFGKIKISREILNKKSSLTTSEFNIIKTHPALGYKIIKDIPFLDKSVSYGVLMHHEREDGSGYPLGLKGDAIHDFGKLIGIADVFDAINSNRGYKRKKAPFEALQIVKNESLGKLNYEYVKVFLEHVVNYYLGEEAILNRGEKCKIIQMNINDLEKPLVLKDGEFIDLGKHKELYIKELLL
ncbi:HD-GYP domain-containing protein [uncultured Clostridium sp.]|uniref:HD-GYP domain-containing protein n=1 Tax=uncultured Clostridium sp. TaxID=59620 RepID=UPI0025D6F34F|nr:HD-GYP domain-containing protein [uncultured Clostridium sp.]